MADPLSAKVLDNCSTEFSKEATVKYPHLGLLEWPFRIVPDESSCSILADRNQLNSDISTLLKNLSRRTTSSIHLMWAWFGAGKSHTLQHIAHLCRTRNQYSSFIPIYTEFPKSIKTFTDLYRECISLLDIETINKAFLEVSTSPEKSKVEKDLSFEYRDLETAFKLLCIGSEDQQNIALRWLRAERSDAQDLRDVNIMKPIRTADDAIKALSWIIKLMILSGPTSGEGIRVIWMIDEFQRLARCPKAVREEVNSCLNSLFNKSPNNLTIIMSFTGKPEKQLPPWISEDIADRIGLEKVMLLPPLTNAESHKFIRDLMDHYRDPYSEVLSPLFPFSENAIQAIVDEIIKQIELKPRAIMHFFNAVLEEAEPLIEKEELSEISESFARSVLKDRVYLEHEE